ncbi:hypothetical protein LWI28_018684 [Acer negundo]|uniref:Uncharacterized protein n=1 Tax=Acer negundo TaxID=4023 RepID=A0AAD5P7G4_ACENE|nr:hypothetical protein LWI28_018684 [Acer negundo]
MMLWASGGEGCIMSKGVQWGMPRGTISTQTNKPACGVGKARKGKGTTNLSASAPSLPFVDQTAGAKKLIFMLVRRKSGLQQNDPRHRAKISNTRIMSYADAVVVEAGSTS